eukprot:m51a1_g11099 hypothetical protein (324) ;mRNA; r:46122-47504
MGRDGIYSEIGKRGGCRGGKPDQFEWGSLKADKYRECYLGQSLHVQPNWWGAKFTVDAVRAEAGPAAARSAAAAELAAVRLQEEQLMREALGLAPAKDRRRLKQMDKFDLMEAVKREAKPEQADPREAERGAGVGFGLSKRLMDIRTDGELVKSSAPALIPALAPPPEADARVVASGKLPEGIFERVPTGSWVERRPPGAKAGADASSSSSSSSESEGEHRKHRHKHRHSKHSSRDKKERKRGEGEEREERKKHKRHRHEAGEEEKQEEVRDEREHKRHRHSSGGAEQREQRESREQSEHGRRPRHDTPDRERAGAHHREDRR